MQFNVDVAITRKSARTSGRSSFGWDLSQPFVPARMHLKEVIQANYEEESIRAAFSLSYDCNKSLNRYSGGK